MAAFVGPVLGCSLVAAWASGFLSGGPLVPPLWSVLLSSLVGPRGEGLLSGDIVD